MNHSDNLKDKSRSKSASSSSRHPPIDFRPVVRSRDRLSVRALTVLRNAGVEPVTFSTVRTAVAKRFKYGRTPFQKLCCLKGCGRATALEIGTWAGYAIPKVRGKRDYHGEVLERRLLQAGKERVASEARITALETALHIVLDSAFPNPTEHPTMFHAWKLARDVLNQPAKEQSGAPR